MTASVEPFVRDFGDEPPVQGVLHRPPTAGPNTLVITHGSGSNHEAPLLIAVADQLAVSGVTVLRCDLPFRQKRPKGPPYPGAAARDREGLRRAVAAMRGLTDGRVCLGGQSYGGRQATLLAADDPNSCDALLLLSYPLHPPGHPTKLRVNHFPKLRTPALFIHGTRDPFGSMGEMQMALKAIPARHHLVEIEGGAHGLVRKSQGTARLQAVAARVSEELLRFLD